MSFPSNHTPEVTDGVEGLLVQIAEKQDLLLEAFVSGDVGDATAGNQTTQITAEQAILAKLPTVGTQAAPGANVITTINPRASRFTNIGADATKNVKASSGNVFSWSCSNANAATRYMQLHNTATIPADQAVPVYSFPVYTLGTTIIGTDFFTTAGVNLATGIAFAFSTTRDTYTAGTAADQSTVVHFL